MMLRQSCLLFLLSLPIFAESLHYAINWQSGLSLGEASIDSNTQANGNWEFRMELDGGVPGFSFRDQFHSTANSGFCSILLEKNTIHGTRKGQETVTFHQDKNSVTRETKPGGGKTDYSVQACAHDALSFLQFVRKELAQGRLVPQQTVVFGSGYQVRMESTGAQAIRSGDQRVDTDRILATIKGSASEFTVEIFFARDPARTPVLARIPLTLGTFSVELIR